MNTYIINLKSEVKRRDFQQQQFEELDLNCEFFDAVTVNDIDEKIYKKHYYDWQRPLRKPEMACYFSHQKCWQKSISTNAPVLILEDDVILSKDTKKILNILENKTGIDLVDFEITNKKKHLSKTSENLIDNYQLLAIYFNSAGAGAYVIYPSGAKKLLNYEAKNGIAPSDNRIKHCRYLKSFQVEPALAIQTVFCQHHQIDDSQYQEFGLSATIKGINNKREFIFRLKRIIAQVKLGFYKLSLLLIAHKRFIAIKNQDFKK